MNIVLSKDAKRIPKSASSIVAPSSALVLAAILGGCGGGGGTASTTTGVGGIPTTAGSLLPPPPSDLDKAPELFGIAPEGVGGDAGGDGGAAGAAGDGSPLGNVTVTLTDSLGNVVSGKTDSNGKFLLKYKTSLFVPPLVLRTVDAGGNVLSSATEQSATVGKTIYANINPMTDKITSDAIGGHTDLPFTGSSVDLGKFAQARSDLTTSVSNALNKAGVSDIAQFDAVRSVYNYDGNGVDAVIESIGHTRAPHTGETQLRVKLLPIPATPTVIDPTNPDGGGLISPTLITAASPLSTTEVALPDVSSGSYALTFAKLQSWMAEMNRCFALSSAARTADADCVDADGTRLVAQPFRQNARDLPQTYPTLYSESDRSPVQGSKLSNPVVLGYIPADNGEGYYPGCTLITICSPPVVEHESTIVQFTVSQPRTGPLAGNQESPIEYTIVMTFLRTDSTSAKAGNWILGGNQRLGDASIRPIYVYEEQMDPAFTSKPVKKLSTMLEIKIGREVLDTLRNTQSSVRAALVFGPGLDSSGVWFTPSTVPGARYLTPFAQASKSSQDLRITRPNANYAPTITLNSVLLDGKPLPSAFWSADDPTNVATPQTDFSAMQALTRYFVFYYSYSPTSAPLTFEGVRIEAPVMPPTYWGAVQRNSLDPSNALVTAPAAGGCSFTLNWSNTPGAAPVDNGFMYGLNATSVPPQSSLVTMNVSSFGMRPTSAAGNTATCDESGSMPALTDSAFRQIGIGATQAGFGVFNYKTWH